MPTTPSADTKHKASIEYHAMGSAFRGTLRCYTVRHPESVASPCETSFTQGGMRVVLADTPLSMLPGISRKRKMRSKF